MGGAEVTDYTQDVKESHIPMKMWWATFLITLPSYVHGYVVSALNACLVTGSNDDASRCYNGDDDGSKSDRCPKGTLYNDVELSTTDAQLATSLIIVGAYLGCLVGSKLSENYGRRKCILVNNLFFVAGSLMCAFGNDKYILFIGRFITGFGFGIETVVVPVLLSEIARPESRGKLTTMHQLQLTLGIMTSGLVSYGFVIYVSQGWRYVQGFYAIPSVLMIFGACWIPESPKWLLARNRKQDAVAALQLVRQDDFDVVGEVDRMEIAERTAHNHNDAATWAEVFSYKRGVMIGIGLQLCGAFTGINTVMFYSATIFGFAGVDQAVLAAAAVGVVNVMSTIMAANLIDRAGRRTLLLIGTSIMMISLLVLSLVLSFANNDQFTQGVIAIMAVLTFVVGYAIGLGAVSWVVMAEIMPTRLRTKAYGFFASISYGCNLIIGLFTLTAIHLLGNNSADLDDDESSKANKNGVAYLYFIFAGICICALSFITFVVPETKGKNPKDFMQNEGVNIYSPLTASELS